MGLAVRGELGEVAFVRLEPNEDVLVGLRDAIREVGIDTGIVTAITGSLNRARIQTFPHVGRECGSIDVIELEGPFEVTGQGLIGSTRGRGGVGRYEEGQPYVHVHLVLTGALGTWCGHLMEGCTVRAHHEVSHFTLAIIPVKGIALTLVAQEGKGINPGFVYHDLRRVDTQ